MMIRTTLVALGALIALGGCADPELAAKVGELEAKVGELEKRGPAAPRAAGPAEGGANDAQELGAREKIGEIQAAVGALDWDKAKSACEELGRDFGATKMAQRGGRVCDEVAVVGKDAMGLDVEKWFKGNASIEGEPTLLVFWESWCPHCKREVPKLAETYKKYDGRMNVVGLTKVTRSSTDESVEAFITEHNIPYPVAKEKGGNLSEYYGVSGVPAAAIVKDGKVIWRGHPARLDDATLEKML